MQAVNTVPPRRLSAAKEGAAVWHKLLREKGVCITRYVLSFFLPSKHGHRKQSKNEKDMYIGVLNYEESKYYDRKGKRVPDNL